MTPAYTGSDRYEVRRTIGAGGMGIVYEAVDRERDTPVALKVLTSSNARWITQFKNEFRALADVVHPNLVAMYELVAEDDHFFFTMELVRGAHFLRHVRPRPHLDADGGVPATPRTDTSSQTHTTIVSTGRRPRRDPRESRPDPGVLDLPRLRRCLPQLADAVAAIHAAGMLHRDLKPSNVLVTADERLVVLDFGLITSVADEDARVDHRPLVGTAAYMAPEQCAREALSQATDWYAVGVMLYQALTGQLPFAGGSDDMMFDKQQVEPTPPNQVAANVPDDLNALCVDLLRRDPSRRPSGAEILRRAGSQHTHLDELAAQPHARGGAMPLVGRERHRAALDEAFATTRRGRAVLMFVRGDSGMGKSTLVRSFLDYVGDRAVVLRGRCYERESVPFKAVDSVVDALAAYLSSLPPHEAEQLIPRHALALALVFPALRQIDAFTASPDRQMQTSDPHLLRWFAFRALRELLRRIAESEPLVIAVDDLQWGDVDSAGLLASLLAPPDPPALLLLGCCRPDTGYANPFLDAFAARTREHGVDTRTVEVGPLSPADATELALLHLGSSGDARAHAGRIAAESAGSPFFVEELARHVVSTGETADSVSLDDALRTRIDRLSPAAMTLLATIAVAGRPVAQSIALRAARVGDPSALALLKARTFIRTLSAAGERYVETYHDRVRETVVAMLPDTALRDRHLELARAIEAGPDSDAEELAIHYHGADRDERAAEYAEIAAQRCADSLAFDQAARMYRLALEAARDPVTVRRLQTRLGDALSNAGRSADAAAVYLDAVDGAGPSEAIELKRRAAEEQLCGGHIAAGLQLVDELLDTVGVRVPATPRRAIVSLLAHRARLALRGTQFSPRDEADAPAALLRTIDTTFAVAAGLGPIDAVRAAALATRHLLLALDAGEPFRVLRGLASEACFVSVKGVGQRVRTEAILARVEALAERVGTPDAHAFTHGARGLCHFQFGDWAQAHDDFAAALQRFREECTGYTWEQSTATIFQAHSLAFMGRIAELNELVDNALRRASERGDLYLDTSLRVAVRFYAHARDDDPDAAIAEIDRSLERWHSGRFDQQVLTALLAYFTIDGYAGEPDRGIERHHRHWGALKRSHMLASQVLRAHYLAFLARLYLQAGARDSRADYLRRVARSARRLDALGAPYTRGFAALLRAGLARAARDDEAALTHVCAAEARFSESNMQLNEAACRVRRGQLVGGDEGAALVAAGRSFIEATGMRNAEAVVGAICPGFGATRPGA